MLPQSLLFPKKLIRTIIVAFTTVQKSSKVKKYLLKCLLCIQKKKIIRAKSVDIETICLSCVFSSNSPPHSLYFIQSYTIQLIYWNLHEHGKPIIFPVISFIHYLLQSWESRAVCLKHSHGYVTMLALKTKHRKLGQDAFINAKSCNKCSHLVSSLHESASNFL